MVETPSLKKVANGIKKKLPEKSAGMDLEMLK